MIPRAELLLRLSAAKLDIASDARRAPMAELAADVVALYQAFGDAYAPVRTSVAHWIHQYRRHAGPTLAARLEGFR